MEKDRRTKTKRACWNCRFLSTEECPKGKTYHSSGGKICKKHKFDEGIR